MNSKIEDLLETANNNEDCSVSSAKRVFTDEAKILSFFAELKVRILNIDEWNKHSNLSSYKLFDERGMALSDTPIAEGLFNRIALKGSGKYDWVKFISIYETDYEMVITVKPTFDPTADKPDKTVISHFFTSEATNNFCLLKHDYAVSFYVIGLNEKQNTSKTNNPLETIRNVAAANLGSYLGIQKGEWETLCKSFLNSVE